jgi:hypothetical protein
MATTTSKPKNSPTGQVKWAQFRARVLTSRFQTLERLADHIGKHVNSIRAVIRDGVSMPDVEKKLRVIGLID